MEPVQFLARLASLIPPPRHPLVRYFGILSSASRWREHVVPKPDETEPERPQRSKPRGKTIDAEDTLAAAGSSAKQAAVGLPSHPPLPHARAPDPQPDLDPVMSVA